MVQELQTPDFSGEGPGSSCIHIVPVHGCHDLERGVDDGHLQRFILGGRGRETRGRVRLQEPRLEDGRTDVRT